MLVRLFGDRLALSLSVRHSRTRRSVRTNRMVGWLMGLIVSFVGLRLGLGSVFGFLGRAGPMSRIVAPNLWSFGGFCPKSASIYVGASEDPVFVSWSAPSLQMVTSELRRRSETVSSLSAPTFKHKGGE
ncbi:hypothetical protein PIB30_002247 [Stylosanthes scabra]|uniref:Uncharacterized protein n=1 Tax=Stylosanthes scabra TaxID=79078 RepID=A0ABU6T334_9FABA|nr:hypothetical protein [Stylosanthes scabra]